MMACVTIDRVLKSVSVRDGAVAMNVAQGGMDINLVGAGVATDIC
jgi:hypothetical protein